ncbi:MAG TPA: radical SAM protein [Chloroflexota bacterium]|nr:radical SAM protein [Chloroflexota bacterium]HUM70795.1 radical SAM protein [Chloroflexota bacterium]
MNSKPTLWGEIDAQGRLILPPALAAQYGLQTGAKVRLESDGNRIKMHRPVTHLAKVYIEPTNLCNIACRTCIRNNWEEKLGRMSDETFTRILDSVQQLEMMPAIFFGGLGEPLFHKQTVDWIAQAHAVGARTELITNGTMLTEKRCRALIEAGLDLIWVSIDGATPESYADVRLGAELPKVIANLSRLRQIRPGGHHPHPEIGIAFVAMARNIHDLPEVLRIGRSVGAKHFSVSNVLPYTEEMQAEMLYTHTLRNLAYLDSPWLPKLSLPLMDLNEKTQTVFFQALQSGCNVNFAGNSLGAANDVCNFIAGGAISIGWDGGVSPCWPLMHNHTSYLHGKPHKSRQHVIGNVNEQDLLTIWLDEEYVTYRQKVQSYSFAPCTVCGGCDLSEENEEDCFGNGFPACGSCLWAQGVIQCP